MLSSSCRVSLSIATAAAAPRLPPQISKSWFLERKNLTYYHLNLSLTKCNSRLMETYSFSRAANFTTSASAQPLTNANELIDSVETFIFDCDGVIWKGDSLIDGVPETLDMLRSKGKRLVFVTNNSTKSRKQYGKKFETLGLSVSEEEIFASSFATAAYLKSINFPSDKKGTITDMVKDASEGISFVCNNISEYGGDPNRIYLMGQSAGAHIAACALIEQAIKESGEGDSTSWSVSQIKAYFGLSGGYNLFSLVDHFHGRGLYRSIFLSIMGGEQSFQRFSPEVVVEDPNNTSAVLLLPPIVLFHGTADYSIPSDSSKCFVDALQRVGAQAELVLYEGKTHTDLFLQDPMRGGKDELLEDILSYIHAGDTSALAKDAVAPPRRRLVPEFMLKLAHKVSPF